MVGGVWVGQGVVVGDEGMTVVRGGGGGES